MGRRCPCTLRAGLTAGVAGDHRSPVDLTEEARLLALTGSQPSTGQPAPGPLTATPRRKPGALRTARATKAEHKSAESSSLRETVRVKG